MKVQNISDIEGFFKVVDSCKGKVELVTGEGDRLNLKSRLTQYVSMAHIFSPGAIPEMDLVAYDEEDMDKIVEFMLKDNLNTVEELVLKRGRRRSAAPPFESFSEQRV